MQTSISFVSVFVFCFFTLASNEQNPYPKLDKIFDGTQGYCPESEPIRNRPDSRQVRFFIDGIDLVIEAVRCVDHKYVPDDTLDENRYVAQKGVTVVERYSQFELALYPDDFSRYVRIPLPDFTANKGARVPLSMIAQVGNTVDINVLTRVDFETSTGYKDFNNLVYGAFRLRFKNR